jgi:hypothetical protein
MTPGWEASYVAKVSAVLNGSITPHQILWELPLSDGLQFVTYWWNYFYERAMGGTVFHGVDCRRVRREEEQEGGEIV